MIDTNDTQATPPLFSTGATSLIAILLLVPFAVRAVCPPLEVYPAILLPVGARIVHLAEGSITSSDITLSAILKDNKTVEVSASKLLEPIPQHFLSVIERNKFGLDSSPTRELKFRRSIFTSIQWPRRIPSNDEQNAVRQWLRDQLNSANIDASELRVTRDDVRCSIANGDIVGRDRLHEFTIQLP